MEVGTEKAQALPLSGMARSEARCSGGLQKAEAKSKKRRERKKWQRGTVAHPLSERQWKRGHFSVTKWESKKHRSWEMPVALQGPCGHRRLLVSKKVESGELVAGPWCSLIMMKKWDGCVGCMAQWSRTRGPAHHQEGGADGLLDAFLKKKKVIGPVRVENKGKLLMDYEEERVSV